MLRKVFIVILFAIIVIGFAAWYAGESDSVIREIDAIATEQAGK